MNPFELLFWSGVCPPSGRVIQHVLVCVVLLVFRFEDDALGGLAVAALRAEFMSFGTIVLEFGEPALGDDVLNVPPQGFCNNVAPQVPSQPHVISAPRRRQREFGGPAASCGEGVVCVRPVGVRRAGLLARLGGALQRWYILFWICWWFVCCICCLDVGRRRSFDWTSWLLSQACLSRFRRRVPGRTRCVLAWSVGNFHMWLLGCSSSVWIRNVRDVVLVCLMAVSSNP